MYPVLNTVQGIPCSRDALLCEVWITSLFIFLKYSFNISTYNVYIKLANFWANILNALHFTRSFVQGQKTYSEESSTWYLSVEEKEWLRWRRRGWEVSLISPSAPSVEIYIYKGKMVGPAKTLLLSTSLPLWFRHQINGRESFQKPSRWPDILTLTLIARTLSDSSPASWYLKDGSMASW